MSYYFSSDGTLKFTTNKVAAKGSQLGSATTSSSSTTSSTSTTSTSKFSAEMKAAALQASGRASTDMKNQALANNPQYQKIAKYRQKIAEIAARKPRTFDDDEDYRVNTSALSAYFAAQESYTAYKDKNNLK